MRLDFEGKQQIYGHHLTVPLSPLVPDDSKSVLTDDGKRDNDNLIIHGDNLYALKALMPKYAGRVKCIYIDPPYNTGNNGWIYSDNMNSLQLKRWFEKQSPVDGEDLECHDKWCCMIWPRLHLLRALLADEGTIFISIDDNEYHHLRMLMDEIFGSANYFGTFVWEGGRKNDAKYISVGHDYILCYARDAEKMTQNTSRWRAMKEGVDEINRVAKSLQEKHQDDYRSASAELQEWFGSLDKRHKSFPHRHYCWMDERGVYFPDNSSWPGGGGPRYSIDHPVTGKPVKVPARGWVISDRAKMLETIKEGRIHFGHDETTVPQLKRYLNETDGQVLASVFYQDRRGATKSLRDILPELPFPYPKDARVIGRLLEIVTSDDDIVLDSFAGSGTTAQAVLALNASDGGNRKFILVECEDYADTITAERVRRVMAGAPKSKDKSLRAGLGGSFTYSTLGDPLLASDMLRGDALPSYGDMATFVYYTATGRTIDPASFELSGEVPFYSDRSREYWLLYRADLDWLRSPESALSEVALDHVMSYANGTNGSDRRIAVFASHKHIPQRKLARLGVTFCQLPFVDEVVS